MEYTLKDAFDSLKDTQTERRNEIDALMNVILNNGSVALNKACTPEDVKKMQHKFFQKLLNRVLEEQPKDYPIPWTSDLNVQVLWEIQEEVQNARELFGKMQLTLADIKQDISDLKHKKEALQKMKEIYLDAAEVKANTNYYKEYQVVKRMFRSVKADLQKVVDILFPDNEDFKVFLGELTSAYTKGGDDIYVEVIPEVLDFVNFLIEADIVSYHRNDKNKVRLMDMV